MAIRFTPEGESLTPKVSKSSQLLKNIGKRAGGTAKEFTREALKGVYGLSRMMPGATLGTPEFSEEEQEKYLGKVGLTPAEEKGTPEKFAGRYGRIFGFGGFFNPVASLIPTVAGQAAEELGAGPKVQSAVEFLTGLKGAGKGKSVQQTGKIAQPRVATKGVSPKEAGKITSSRLSKQVERVNEEASELAKDIGKGNKKFEMISGSIQKGEPIKDRFNKFFTNLENYTHANNQPLNNLKPLDNFLSNEAKLYQQTGAPTDLSQFVMNEIDQWKSSGSNNWYNLFRRYRLNNQKSQELARNPNIDPSIRRQKMSFLSRMNESIGETFKNSLPPNHPWINAFEQSNNAYSSYQNTLQAKRVLDPLISKNMPDAQLTNFINNPRVWEDLERFLGPKDSNGLKSILTDLQTARRALKGMQKFPKGVALLKELGKGALLKSVGLSKLYALMQLPNALKWAVGRYYSSPSFQGNLHEFVSALTENNVQGAFRALENMKEEKPEEEKKEIRFKEF